MLGLFDLEGLTVPTLVPQRRSLGSESIPVLVPYSLYHEAARAAVTAAQLPATYAPCSADDDYYWYVSALWERRQTFTILEHDIAPRPGDWEELLACPHPWCGFVYSITTQYAACNGFTKYDASLLAKFPDMMAWVGDRKMSDDGSVQRHWVRLDTRMFQYLHNHGYEIHPHWPPVPHLNPRQHLRVESERGYCRWPATGLP